MAAVSAEDMRRKYEAGTQAVTYEDYCGKQIRLGVSQAVCQARYENYKRRVAGKGQKFLTRWQGGA